MKNWTKYLFYIIGLLILILGVGMYRSELGRIIEMYGISEEILMSSEEARFHLRILPYSVIIGTLLLYITLIGIMYHLAKKQRMNLKLFLALSVLISVLFPAIILLSIEPIIATDYFEYGFRQELNKVLERITYSSVNQKIYGFFLIGLILFLAAYFLELKQSIRVGNDKSA